MKKLLLIFIVLASSFILPSCCGKKKATAASTTTETAQPTIDFEKNGYAKATVINYNVDGCGFLIQLEDGKKLQATNLSAEFMKDKLDVWIKYSPKKGGMSVCMVGPMIELTDIQMRK